MSDWKDAFREQSKEADKRVKSTMSKADQKALGTSCSVCLAYRQGELPLIGRFSLDGSDILVCDRCLSVILDLKFSNPEQTEGRQWNWAPIKARVRG